eukprot:7344919-Karenia_brevis.AAC.1
MASVMKRFGSPGGISISADALYSKKGAATVAYHETTWKTILIVFEDITSFHPQVARLAIHQPRQ